MVGGTEVFIGSIGQAGTCHEACPSMQREANDIVRVEQKLQNVGRLGKVIGLQRYYSKELAALEADDKKFRMQSIILNCPGPQNGECWITGEDESDIK